MDNSDNPTTRAARPRRRLLAVVVALGLLAGGCSIAADDVTIVAASSTTAPSLAPRADGLLPALGPIPNSSHWHAAYVVRICDDVLVPFESDADPLGIHSHADGLMHIHPFFEESGYENARLQLFGDAMGFDLSEGELTLPDGGTWRDGDLCNGVPGRIFVDRWRQPVPNSPVERIFDNFDELRFEADGEMYQIAFAPEDSLSVVPPSYAGLDEVSALAQIPPEPWVDVDPAATRDDVRIWLAAGVSAQPCTEGQIPERVLSGTPACFEASDEVVEGRSAITGARAVMVNRAPAVELAITPELYQVILNRFLAVPTPMTLAIEIDGFVVTAPQLSRPPASPQRLVVSGGFTVDSAQALADVLNS